MKITSISLIVFLFSISILQAQEKRKDTLYFAIDKYYTVSPTITPNLNKQISYSDKVKNTENQWKKTKTHGYIFFIGDGYLIRGLKPKTILSIKDFIENKKFYFDGKYNKIINNQTLKDSLTNKYTVIFVNGKNFIIPRYLEYQSFSNFLNSENKIKNNVKDSLFFELDKNYLHTYSKSSNLYYINETSYKKNGTLTFKANEIKNIIKPNEILSIKKFIQSPSFYNPNKKIKLDDEKLLDYLINYEVFFVEKDNFEKKKYFKVSLLLEIE